MDPALIRNFAIIAHIDHGKSTLADRLLELTGSLTAREMQAQVLDAMDLERERGITIKAHSVRMMYPAADGKTYQLNLIDTPGHVDFSYEVSRSLASCEGALLVVDASQGVEAQTLANAYIAINNGLEIIPVINKIDLPSADIERTKEMIESAVGLDASHSIAISAKTGMGVPEVLEAVVKRIPPPKGKARNQLQALIFDSWFDSYRGVVVLARVIQGTSVQGPAHSIDVEWSHLRRGDAGCFDTQADRDRAAKSAGEVGFLTATIKTVADCKIGDTITDDHHPAIEPLPGFEELKPMVFAGLYTVDAHEHTLLREALEKLRLNDSSFFFEPESSVALGFGFRCGFLGLLHMEIIQERLEREYNLDLITTAPGVRYKITLTDGSVDRSGQSVAMARSQRNRQDRRAGDPGHHSYQRGIRRWHSETGRGQARQAKRLRIRKLHARDVELRIAAERDCARLLRQAEDHFARLRFARLSPRRNVGSRRW